MGNMDRLKQMLIAKKNKDRGVLLASEAGAPGPSFGLTEERAASPEYKKATESLSDLSNRIGDEQDALSDGQARKIAKLIGADPEEMVTGSRLASRAGSSVGSIKDVAGKAGRLVSEAGQLIPTIRAESAAQGIAKAKELTPSMYGRIIQVGEKEAPQFVPEFKKIKNLLRSR